MRAAHSGFVILELPAHNVVVRRIAVPVQAREFLSGVVRNQIERLSPWQAEQAVYGFDADVNPEDAANLDVRVLIASRAVVDGARDALAAIGLAVDRVVTRDAEGAASVTLWSRLADVTREIRDQVRLRIGVGLAALVVISLGLSLWAIISAASVRDDSEELAARVKTLQRQVQGPRSPQQVALLSPSDRAWYAKETSPSAVIVLEALSRALPDTAYLTELHLESGSLRIDGLANDAPSLLAPLEHSGHLTDLRFFAPTTRGTDGTLFRFHIEARVEPHFKIAED
jgi:general secretion pathway protein L